ncbi:MAG: hypothetical protein KME23_13800 [Goleter apudmare HA4340-LM2]|jgi:hypothetical protein|nr:hypothetical protein [Goleter apudmare HA4340-LM2]
MKNMFLLPSRIVMTTLAGIGFASLLMPQASLADLGQPDNRPGFDSSNGSPCGGSQDGSFNMFNLIHCANLNNGQFDSNQGNASLDAEAEAFAKKQQQIFQGKQPQTNPATSGNQPLGNTPLEIRFPLVTPSGN